MEIKRFTESAEKVTKAPKNSPYTRFLDDTGKWMSCFDKNTSDILKSCMGKRVVVEIKVQGDFSNIASCGKIMEDEAPQEPVKANNPLDISPEAEKMGTPKRFRDESRMASMLLSYAKDLVVADRKDCLAEAIKDVHTQYLKIKTQLENE